MTALLEDVIVVIEDDPDDRHLLARSFRKLGSSVPLRFACDGDEALTLLSGLVSSADQPMRPLVILLDLKLPRRSGFEVLTWIKAQPALRRIPVVILTSSRENSDLRQAYDLGANSFLVKPSQPQALHSLIEQVNGYWLGHNEVAPLMV
ncbi:response regulator [Methylobacterium iners]|jgi:CheY-like chemotaxis protein|uniref:Response regulator rcp1 n=1 Tax=Methylobacterium iners TaxID=418707 RepID=A0ABQ4RYH4_9HYPH|nr:response regulator [Methylobacterium iners]GJD94683.1 Response regulator rcp1 [Methylobacterium iners]